MKEQSSQNLLRDFNLTIKDNVTVPMNSIIKLTIDYDLEKPYVSGSFEFETEFDLGEALQFTGEMNLSLKAKDILENEVDEKFVIYDFSCVRNLSKGFSSSGKFLDIISWDLSKKFISKGFTNCDMKDVLNDTDIAQESFQKVSKETEFDDTKKVENFIIPGDRNLLSIQTRMKEYFNCVYFHTHNKIKIKRWDNLYKKSILRVGDNEVTYKSPAGESVFMFDVVEYKTIGASGVDVSKFGVNVKTYSYNPLNRTVKPFEYSLKQANTDMGNLDEIQEIPQGTKSLYVSHINPEEQTKYHFQRNLMFNSQFMLLSSGFLCVNPGDTVNLSIEGAENSVENISGKYLITKVTDSITQGYLTQRVLLTRPSPAKVGS